MFKVNYHTHTTRCHHAVGTDREYVEAAIKAGLKKLGFSDHSPMITDNPNLKNPIRVKIEETDEYFSSLLALKEEYKNDIEIKIGFEAEYFPDVFDRYIDFVKGYPIDYLILGQHSIDKEVLPPWASEMNSGKPKKEEKEEERGWKRFTDTEMSAVPSDSEERLVRFFGSELTAAKSGYFSVIGHPDIINFTGDEEIFARRAREFLEGMLDTGVALEINRLGLREGRNYPRELFWKECAKVGNPVIIGLDAHDPAVFADREGIDMCLDYADRLGVNLIEDIELKKI